MNPFSLGSLSSYIRKFLLSHSVMPRPHQRVLVALSGGRDSVLLLKVMIHFKHKKWIKDVHALHVDYGTWGKAQEVQCGLVSMCREENIGIDIRKHPLKKETSNFESLARRIRYKEFDSFATDWIVLGHHLNDSFEWSLMQQLKGCSKILGIPLRRGKFLRPLMCLSREHIGRLCKENGFPYWDDPTGVDLRFERNALRHRVMKPLAQLYPKMLKHYAIRHNQLALSLREDSKSSVVSRKIHDAIVLIDKNKNHFLGRNEEIVRAVSILSLKGRGKIQHEISKIPQAMIHGRRGPFLLSGSVEVHLGPHRLLLCRKNSSWFERADREMTSRLRNSPCCLLGNLIHKNPSSENIFTEYVILKAFPQKYHKEFLRGLHPQLKNMNLIIKKQGLRVIRMDRLRRLCSKFPPLLELKVSCLYV